MHPSILASSTWLSCAYALSVLKLELSQKAQDLYHPVSLMLPVWNYFSLCWRPKVIPCRLVYCEIHIQLIEHYVYNSNHMTAQLIILASIHSFKNQSIQQPNLKKSSLSRMQRMPHQHELDTWSLNQDALQKNKWHWWMNRSPREDPSGSIRTSGPARHWPKTSPTHAWNHQIKPNTERSQHHSSVGLIQ